ncbi:hypothetical protein [Micromonospora pattaloongensis]|uniref:hypothetical protein n=1 Tax=Micromonospora pattaloongensis TaxID=405436 RepID=UPI0011152534|nr:hypothetical protein [Micromonospora pattaloongensis]
MMRTASLRVVARSDAGVAVLAAAGPDRARTPATNGSWAESLRQFTRAAVWVLPVYGLLYGASTLGDLHAGGPSSYLAHGQPVRLIGWVAALCLGLIALVAVAAIHAGARGRRSAALGLVVGLVGAALMLSFVVLPGRTRVGVIPSGAFTLAGASLYSVGWLLVGWAVVRSRLFSLVDGVMLIVAAPMLGVAGLLIGPLQTVGAMLAVAAGIGLAWTAGRLIPTVGGPELAGPPVRQGSDGAAAGRPAAYAPVATHDGDAGA